MRIVIICLMALASINIKAQEAESGTQILVSAQPSVWPELKSGLESPTVHVHLVFPLPEKDTAAIGEGSPPSSGVRMQLTYFLGEKRNCTLSVEGKHSFDANGITVQECVYLVKHRIT